MDFDHGTGHGVGAALCVHEGPLRISRRSELPLEPGMIFSNEPGYYRTGHYGIRIENQVEVVEVAEVEPDLRRAVALMRRVAADTDRPMRIFTTYTAMLALRSILGEMTDVEEVMS